MSLYYRLQASPAPLRDDFALPNTIPPNFSYFIYDTSILSDSIMKWYKSKLNLDIDLAVLFVRIPKMENIARKNQGVIHSDVTWSASGWQKVHYGVNYELTDDETILSWWSTTDQEIYPPYPEIKTNDDNLRGIHYGKRSNFDPIDDRYTLIDSINITSGPTLVNTSTPHSVNYSGKNSKRFGLSLRFSNTVNSWSEAVELFDSIIV
jgi:hypothetical protein